MGILGSYKHSEFKLRSRDELPFQDVAKKISRWLHKAGIFPDHDHHHRHEFYKPKRYVAASIAAAGTVPGPELEKKIQLATSANGEATAHFLRTCTLVEQYKACHFKHEDNSSLCISNLRCPLDHGFDYEEQDLSGTTIYYNADNAVVCDVPEAMQAKSIILFERFATYDAESILRSYAGTQRMVVLIYKFPKLLRVCINLCFGQSCFKPPFPLCGCPFP